MKIRHISYIILLAVLVWILVISALIITKNIIISGIEQIFEDEKTCKQNCINNGFNNHTLIEYDTRYCMCYNGISQLRAFTED